MAIAGHCLHRIEVFFFPLCPPARRPGYGKNWEGAEPGQVTPADHKYILCFMLCSEIEAQEKEEDAGTFMVMTVVFPSNLYEC